MLRIDAANIIFIVINLLILFVAMKKFLFAPVLKIIEERQAEADKQLESAAATQAEAESLKAEYVDSLAGIEEEKKKTLQEARRDADTQYQKILQDAEDKARQLREKAVYEAETQKKEILKSAEKEIADMVVDAARKVVGKQRGMETDHSLYDEFLNKAGES